MFLSDWYYALRCRLLYHPHRLHIHHPDLTGWSWRDRDTIMLCACFQLLVDYVELELPQFSRWCGEPKWYRWVKYLPFFSWYMDKQRDPEAGVQHLHWAMGPEVAPSSQADYAKEHLELYLWWTQERPARVSPWKNIPDRPGESIRELFNREHDPDGSKAVYFAALDKAQHFEELYELEDERQLVRLMKVRRGLWT